jgi:hypothetical protein
VDKLGPVGKVRTLFPGKNAPQQRAAERLIDSGFLAYHIMCQQIFFDAICAKFWGRVANDTKSRLVAAENGAAVTGQKIGKLALIGCRNSSI